MSESRTLKKMEGYSREELELEYLRVKRENDFLRKHIFGHKSERHVPPEVVDQLKLDLGEIGQAEAPPEMEAITYERKKKKRKPHPGRNPLPAHLPRKEIIIEPEEDVTGWKYIGDDVTETLGYIPPKFFINRYIKRKYARPDGEAVAMGQMPSRPIDKGIAEASLLTAILIDKYMDHMPLYRQIQRFKREGIVIPDSTLGDWVAQVCMMLLPLFEAHRNEVLTQWYLMVDETTTKVIDRQKKKNIHLGYFWVYYSPLRRLVLFDYQPTRGKEEPMKCLKNYQGYLQTDGYQSYNQFKDKKGVVMLSCMAHARRKFFEAGEKEPRVIHALKVFRELYKIEAEARQDKFTPEQRQEVREKQARPIWEEFKGWLIDTYKELTPKHALRKAVAYTLNRWNELGRYILKGEFEIDNNLIENQIRPVALGRKNYLFAGSHNGARRSAMIYSLLGTCKAQGIEPYAWLRDVLERLPDHPVNRVGELLPQNWAPKEK